MVVSIRCCDFDIETKENDAAKLTSEKITEHSKDAESREIRLLYIGLFQLTRLNNEC